MPPRQVPPVQELLQLRQQFENLTTVMAEMKTQHAAEIDRLTYQFTHHPQRPCSPPLESFDNDDTVSMENPFTQLDPRDNLRAPCDNRWEMKFKLDLPEFNGGLAAAEYLDWIAAVEGLLDFKAVPTNRRVGLVVTRFRGCASAWWQQLKSTRSRHGKPTIQTWSKFHKHIDREFLPFNYLCTLFQQLQNLRQGS